MFFPELCHILKDTMEEKTMRKLMLSPWLTCKPCNSSAIDAMAFVLSWSARSCSAFFFSSDKSANILECSASNFIRVLWASDAPDGNLDVASKNSSERNCCRADRLRGTFSCSRSMRDSATNRSRRCCWTWSKGRIWCKYDRIDNGSLPANLWCFLIIDADACPCSMETVLHRTSNPPHQTYGETISSEHQVNF